MELEQYFPFWNKLSHEQQQRLESSTNRRQYPAGTIVHSGRHDCLGLLLILSGQLRVYIITEEGKELTLYRLFDRDICLFTASCIMNSIQFDVTISADQDTTVLHIPPDVYKQCMQESAPASNYINELMASRFSDVMWILDQVLSKKLDTRLAAFLIEESELSGRSKLVMTHEQIANHLGSAREVISRMLKYMQNEGLVALGRGSITLVDIPELTQLAQASLR